MSMQNEFNANTYNSNNVSTVNLTRKERLTQADNTMLFWMLMVMIIIAVSITYFVGAVYVINNVNHGMFIVECVSSIAFITIVKLLIKD